jgi:hypothetical protein
MLASTLSSICGPISGPLRALRRAQTDCCWPPCPTTSRSRSTTLSTLVCLVLRVSRLLSVRRHD